MKSTIPASLAPVIAFALMLAGCDSLTKDINVVEGSVWSRPARVIEDSIGGMGAVYLTIENSGRIADRFVGVETDVSETAEIHEAVMSDGKMTMKRVEGGVEIPPKGRFELAPGRHHIMLIRLKRHLEEGDRFKVKLNFEKRKSIEIESVVKIR